jgi:ribosome-binding ATPase YchF (GTP1/OBG family)
MKIALLGMQGAGKTTLFHALTGVDPSARSLSARGKGLRIGVARVPDGRVERLASLYHPRKTSYASIEFVDGPGVPGEDGDSRPGAGLAAEWVRASDALALVLRNFQDGHPSPPDPAAELQALLDEMILRDLLAVEKRLERIEWLAARGKKTGEHVLEEKALRALGARLENGEPVSSAGWDEDRRRRLQGFHFLSAKPLLVLVNSGEADFGNNKALLGEIARRFPAVELDGLFETELIRLSPEDAREFLQDLGLESPASDRVIRKAYDLLGALSFFTVGEDEVRAWTAFRGDTALDAARSIHSDLARGFIRAECFTYEDLIGAGSEKGVRERGRFRLEGKTYPVRDGDILSIRFSV